MTKLFKLLMVLLIPLFSLTVTSCGDGDDDENKDEPNKPTTLNSTFLIGTWVNEYDETKYYHYSAELTFKKDGQYYFKRIHTYYDYDPVIYEEIGTYSYSKGKLSTKFSSYDNGVFMYKSSTIYDILFDEYTSKLVIYNATDGSGMLARGQLNDQAQYSKQ